jgi:hypothetical protein
MSEVTYVRGNGSFGPEDIAQLVAGLELALTNLGIKDRNDPTAILLAKLIIQLAIDGERDPTRLAARAMGLLPSALQLEQKRQPMTKRASSGCRTVPNPPSATHAYPRSYVRTWHRE